MGKWVREDVLHGGSARRSTRDAGSLWEVDGCSIVVDVDAMVAVVLDVIEVSGTMPMYLPFVSTIRGNNLSGWGLQGQTTTLCRRLTILGVWKIYIPTFIWQVKWWIGKERRSTVARFIYSWWAISRMNHLQTRSKRENSR